MSIDDDFAQRELCPDGACIGLIGPDQRCRVCGTVSGAAVRDPRLPPTEDELAVSPAPETLPPAPETLEIDDADFDRRELCPDGGCVGVLDEARRCKVCGATAPLLDSPG
jgi:hypothetical protein